MNALLHRKTVLPLLVLTIFFSCHKEYSSPKNDAQNKIIKIDTDHSIQMNEGYYYWKEISSNNHTLIFPAIIEPLGLYLCMKDKCYFNHYNAGLNYSIKFTNQELSGATDYYLARYLYATLSDHYMQIGNFSHALYYRKLQTGAEDMINRDYEIRKLTDAGRTYQSTIGYDLKEKGKNRACLFFLAFFIFMFILIFYFREKYNRLKYQKIRNTNKQLKEINRHLKHEYDSKVDNLIFLKKSYCYILCECRNFEKEIRTIIPPIASREDTRASHSSVHQSFISFKEKTLYQLLSRIKEYLRKDKVGIELIRRLTNEELLLFSLYYYEYNKSDIASILGVSEEEVENRKNKLECKIKPIRIFDKPIIDNVALNSYIYK